MGKRPGPGKRGVCDMCRKEKPHIYRVSWNEGETWHYVCPECAADLGGSVKA